MTQENKQLLLKDLCARLPYGVKCKDWTYGVNDEHIDVIEILDIIEPRYESYQYKGIDARHDISRIRPYLRPMSSMTEEEEQDYASLSNHCISTSMGFAYLEAQVLVEWLNFHHFDFRNLIERGLALEAPEGMYKTE